LAATFRGAGGRGGEERNNTSCLDVVNKAEVFNLGYADPPGYEKTCYGVLEKQITFTLRKEQCPVVYINNTVILQSPTAKYLHLDSRLTWAQHLAKKRKQVDLKVKDLYWVIGRKSPASLESKVLLYKTTIKPIWTYGIELWGFASKLHIAKLQRRQSKILRAITNAPWYVTSQTLHDDLKVPFIKDVIQEKSINHHDKLGNHSNPILQPLLEQQRKRLKKLWPADLIDG
jgi:hypothetical protein